MPTQAANTYIEGIRHLPVGSALIIPDVSWAEYEELLAELGEGYAVRVTYDRGRLEIVSPSGKHEKWSRLIEGIARVLATELGTELESFGSTTFKQQALQQGAEPDACFYVQSAARVIGKADLDLAVDPAPDLVVEIDVSHSSKRTLAFYATIGVPEVWRYDGQRLSMHQRGAAGYTEVPASLAFPGVTADSLAALLRQLETEGQQTVLEAFRRSFRERGNA
jgi:Uma2 family endonuclease